MKKYFNILVALLLLAASTNAQFGFDTEFVQIKTFSSFDKVQPNGEIKIAIELDILEHFHINANKPHDDFLIPTELIIKTNNADIVSILYPEPKDVTFSFSDDPVSVYDGIEFIGAILKISESAKIGMIEIPIEISYQACNDESCMAPSTAFDTLRIEVVDNLTPINEVNQEIFSKLDISYTPIETTVENDDDGIASTLESSGLILSLLFVFLGGLALNLTPCVYPLIPITIGYFGGQSEGKTSKLFVLGVLYVLGMALTYSIVGVVTALSGAIFGALLQNPFVIVGIAAVFVILALSMFGLYEIKAPDALVAKAGGARSGVFGAFFMGLTMGVVAAPCIGPFVIGLVTYVAAKGDVFYGFIMFFFLAIGLGTPYLFLAIFSGRIKSLPRAGFWMDGVKHIFGFILFGMAIYFINPILPKVVAYYLLPIFLIGAGIYLLFIDKLANDVKGYRIFKSLFSVLMIAAAAWMLVPIEKSSPNWEKYSIEKYETALQNNNKIIIDFYADWCIPCKELDALTFSDKKVIDALSNFKALKVDMTKSMSEQTEIIREKFKIIGMPTVLLIDSNGNEVKRITGFVNAEDFEILVNNVK
ncbi:MAG: protein-disulfide reductase DsbD [Melioribacteraceae bacterium]|nr:protein-disulfide reductase DsbD [Melioribacteraceae bacterium]